MYAGEMSGTRADSSCSVSPSSGNLSGVYFGSLMDFVPEENKNRNKTPKSQADDRVSEFFLDYPPNLPAAKEEKEREDVEKKYERQNTPLCWSLGALGLQEDEDFLRCINPVLMYGGGADESPAPLNDGEEGKDELDCFMELLMRYTPNQQQQPQQRSNNNNNNKNKNKNNKKNKSDKNDIRIPYEVLSRYQFPSEEEGNNSKNELPKKSEELQPIWLNKSYTGKKEEQQPHQHAQGRNKNVSVSFL